MPTVIDDNVERTVLLGHSTQEVRVRLVTDLYDVFACAGSTSSLVYVDPNQVRSGPEEVTQQLEAPASIDANLEHANRQAAVPVQMTLIDREVMDPFVERVSSAVCREERVQRIAGHPLPVIADIEGNAIALVDQVALGT